MLQVDIRELRRGPVETVGQLRADDPTLRELELELLGPVAVDGKLQAAGDSEFLWRGHIAATVHATCRRCLAEVEVPVATEVGVMFSTDPEAVDDPSVYPLSLPLGQIDVREAVREELALAVPPFVLCREDCAGLCPGCGADLNAGPCGCTAPAEPH